MKNKLLVCTVVLLAVFFNSATAQSDTSNYDLGRLTLQRKFTQAITIKAADMEKMPFSSLSEVINIYFNGIYGNKQTLAYVIDGNLNTDIGAYSIYDIDEITFIQNATTVLNGITPTQVLVLVKTKRGGAGRSGIMVNGQTNVVTLYTNHIDQTAQRSYNSGTSTVNLYHQYYLSGYVNKKKYSAGISASVQHNVFPQYWNKTIFSTIKPYTSDRFRFNGYIDVRLGKKNVLSVSGGYVPQRDRQTQINAFVSPNGKSDELYIYDSQNLYYADLKLKSQILKGLNNVLSAGFQRVQTNANYDDFGQIFNFIRDSVTATNTYLVKDELSYVVKIGDLTLNPAVNITYRQGRDSSRSAFGRIITKQKMVVVTPSLTVNYDDVVMLQGGIQRITNTNILPYKGYDFPKLLPFGSVSVDVLRPFEVSDTTAKLMLYGSFARNQAYMGDLIGSLSYHIGFLLPGSSSGPMYNSMVNPYKTYDQLQGGLTLSLFKNTVSFSYNYNIQKFNTSFSLHGISAAGNPDTSRLTDASINIHRVGLNFKLISTSNFSWSTNLNANLVIKKQPDNDYLTSDLMKYFYPGKRFITGGFVNQLTYKEFVAGIDVLYGINKARYTGGRFPVVIDHSNVIDLQNFYVGYKVPVQKVKSLEVYVNARNLLERGIPLEAENLHFYDDRRFIGAGFKLGL